MFYEGKWLKEKNSFLSSDQTTLIPQRGKHKGVFSIRLIDSVQVKLFQTY